VEGSVNTRNSLLNAPLRITIEYFLSAFPPHISPEPRVPQVVELWQAIAVNYISGMGAEGMFKIVCMKLHKGSTTLHTAALLDSRTMRIL
jgi:hypothetical protein